MVTIVGYAERKNAAGENFFALMLQGGIEIVVSKATGKPYVTAKKASIPCTFSEDVVKTLIGTTLSGVIAKVPSDPYDYTLPNGEVIQLDYSYQYAQDTTSVEAVVMG